MLKRLTFAPAGAGPRLRPADGCVRAALCSVLPELSPGAEHGAVLLEWFDDAAGLDAGTEPAGSVVVAEEHVLRGEAWLAQRWVRGGPQLKHMAVATRAAGLTQAEFQARWRSRAGSVGTVAIPDEAKGLAYVQDHPVPGSWPYDAVNEVWFDDLDGLRTRIEWFAQALGDGTEDDLVGRHRFLAVREEPLDLRGA